MLRPAAARLPSWSRVVAIEVAIVALLAVAMLVMGRSFFCRCDVVALWSGDIMSNQNSQQFADPYSFTHITHGVLLYWLVRALWRSGSFRAHLIAVTAIEALWEAIENTDAVINRYRETTVSLGYYGDSVLNSMNDVAFCVVGAIVASRLSGRLGLLGIVAMEAILLVWIRDSLLLNIIMLFFPIAAVRNWQLGG